jgi:hypothetical protein
MNGDSLSPGSGTLSVEDEAHVSLAPMNAGPVHGPLVEQPAERVVFFKIY